MSDTYTRSDQDISGGVRTGIRTARTARNVAKAVGKAVSGNLAGAAVDILKDDNLRSLIGIILAVGFFIVFCVVFVIPMSIYEGLQAYVDGLTEQWKIDYYSGDSGRFMSFLKATAGLIANLAQDIWNNISSSRTDENDTDLAENADLGVVTSQDDLFTVYSRKIKAGKDKFTARQNTVAKTIEQDAYTGEIGSIMYGQYMQNFYGNFYEYDTQYNTENNTIVSTKINVYDGCEVVAIKKPIKDTDALKLLCLYTAQEGSSIENIQLSGFMKWLGYNGSNNRRLEYTLGENESIRYDMSSWTGGFMPQYLEDEAAEVEQTYREHGASLADLLIQIDCPSLYSIQPSVTEELKEDAGTAYHWVIDYSSPIYENPPEKETDSMIAGQPFDTSNDTVVAGGNIIGYNYKQVPYNYDVTYMHVKYIIPVTISCRSIEDVLKIAGLWTGFLPEDAERYSSLLGNREEETADTIDLG